MCSKLSVELFGVVRVHRDGELINLTHASQALFGFLVLQGAHRTTRPALMELVAPDQPQDAARRRLNTAVWRLRRSLEPDGISRDTVLLGEGGLLLINPECELWVDAVEFERVCERFRSRPVGTASEAQEVIEAVGRYRGELLPGLDDDWAVRRRARLADLHLDALAGLAHWYRRGGDATSALRWIDSALAVDPSNERLHRIAMATYADAGMKELVQRQFEHCAGSLAAIGVSPSDATISLRQRLLAGRRSRQAERTALQSALVELEDAGSELERLRRRIDRTTAKLHRALESDPDATA